MTYCVKCGEKLPEGARVCPKCDTPVSGVSTGGVSTERRSHLTVGSVGGALILIGGILAIVLNIIPLLSMLFLRQTIQQLIVSWGMGMWRTHLTQILAFFTVGTIVTIIM